ncbi:MAG: hypothetical protein P8J74_06410 [Woeseiaceae bacterium]|nr:hypothetical protein [Woeseiaceae bacterium]
MYRLIILISLIIGAVVWAQDLVIDEELGTTPKSSEVENPIEDELEELNIDDQQDYIDEDEDVFKPTDAISYSQQIRFPVDI